MAVDAGQYVCQPGPLGVAEVGRGTDMRHHLAAAGHRDLGQIAHGLVVRVRREAVLRVCESS